MYTCNVAPYLSYASDNRFWELDLGAIGGVVIDLVAGEGYGAQGARGESVGAHGEVGDEGLSLAGVAAFVGTVDGHQLALLLVDL